MLLACLDFQNTNHGKFKYQGFSEIAKELDVQVESISYDGSMEGAQQAWDKATRLINEASAFFVPNSRILHSAIHPKQIRDRIAQGARFFVTPWINDDERDRWNGFLARYELTVTTIRIHSGKPLAGAGGYITIKRDANSFRDPLLFQSVDEVVLSQPVAMWYGGESLPVLIANDAELAIDAEKDLPTDWNARELACMAIWRGELGAVLASRGPVFYDPFPQQNQRLATNVIRFLCESRTVSPEERCRRIEENLCDFVLGVAKATGGDWWTERVPLTIRQKCAERHEEEKCRLPKEAYLDLIDLKTIMEKQWKLFEQHLRAEGCEGGKEKSLAWLDRLNEMRRLVGHPLKKHIAGYKFSTDEIGFLANCDDLVRRLFRRVKPAS